MLCTVLAVSVSFLRRRLHISPETKSTFLVWSAGDCSGVNQILGLRTMSAIGESDAQVIHPIDALDDGTYFDLKYPLQCNGMVYYTVTNAETGEECIAVKSSSEPRWITPTNAQDGSEHAYYRRTDEWNIILSQYGEILHKRMADSRICYLLWNAASDAGEIRCFDMETGTDTVLVADAHPRASFDVRADGALLYVNAASEIILLDAGEAQPLGMGMTACFLENGDILKVTDAGVFTHALSDGTEKKLCSVTGQELSLSPSGTYAALCSGTEQKGLENDALYVIDLAVGRVREIESAPDVLCGIAWFSDLYPIS